MEDQITPLYREVQWYRDQLGRFTYKPGWRFYIETLPGIYPHLVAVTTVADTYYPVKTVEVSCSRPLLGVRDEEFFARTVEALVQMMEAHEAQEWLKRDGQIYNDPHKQRS